MLVTNNYIVYYFPFSMNYIRANNNKVSTQKTDINVGLICLLEKLSLWIDRTLWCRLGKMRLFLKMASD
jgi:hypothetical protein